MLNRAVLMGRITADPELRATPNGVNVTSFTVAVDRPYARGAERQTDFIDCVAWRNTAEFVCKYFQKGSPIVVEGRIQVSSYTDRNNEKRRRFEVVADNVNFVVGAPKSEGTGGGSAQARPVSQIAEPVSGSESSGVAFASGDLSDFKVLDDEDDLPF